MKTKPGKSAVKKKNTATFTEAEKGWTPFWNHFSEVIRQRDYKSLKLLMVIKYLDCNIYDESNLLDLRDDCITDWKKTADNKNSGVKWSDFLDLISSPTFCKTEKEDGSLGWKFQRFVPAKNYNCQSDGLIAARFVFVNDKWLLQAFKQWESE